MAELTNLEEKLAEVVGLAMAAQGAVDKISKLEEAEEHSGLLDRMSDEAAETEKRGRGPERNELTRLNRAQSLARAAAPRCPSPFLVVDAPA